MDQRKDLLYEQKDQNGKLKIQHPGEGQKVMEEKHPQNKGRPASHAAVQTEQEQSDGQKGLCVTVQVQQQPWMTVTVQQQWEQQQWDGGGEVPAIVVRVQQQRQKPEQPCVVVQLQQEWNKIGEVSVKIQQHSMGRRLHSSCVTVQVQQESQEAEIPSENDHMQNTDKHEEVPHVREDQQARCKEGLLAAEEEHQQPDQESIRVIESESLKQVAVDSVVKCLFQQDRWNQSTEKLKQVQFLQTEQEENRMEMGVSEKHLYDVKQTAKVTKTFDLHPLTLTEDNSKEANTEQQNEDKKRMSSSDEGMPKATTEEQKVHEHKKQSVSKRGMRAAPNYFVAIPVTNDQILDKIEDVQELIFTKEPALLRALIPVQAVHLTIIVAHLRTEEDVKRAISALEKSKAEVEGLLQGKCFTMTFCGIGQFNNQVIYAKMLDDDQQMLSIIAEIVVSSFNEMNIDIRGSKDFKPHLTFLKLSRAPALRRKGFRKISANLYTEYEDSLFGTEIFRRIDLCAMHKKKQDSGYYHCECSIYIYPTSSEDKKELQTEDLKENVIGAPLNDGADDNTRATLL